MAENSQKHLSREKSFLCCKNTTGVIYINPQLHFTQWTLILLIRAEGVLFLRKNRDDKNQKYLV